MSNPRHTDTTTEGQDSMTTAFPWDELDETPAADDDGPTVEAAPDPAADESAPDPAEAAAWPPADDETDDDGKIREALTGRELEVSDAVIDLRAAGELLDDLGGHPEDLARVAGSMKETILSVVRTRGDARRAARVARLDGAEPRSSTDVRRELVGATEDGDVLEALAGAFTAGGKEARGIAGDLLDELPGRGGKPRGSVKAADGHGWEITLTRSPRRELSVEVDDLIGILVAALVSDAQRAQDAARDADDGNPGPLDLGRHPAKVYADAARTALGAFRDLLAASPGFKSTALDALATRLEDTDGDDLAARLRKAYARVDKGEPTIKVTRKPLPEKGDDE